MQIARPVACVILLTGSMFLAGCGRKTVSTPAVPESSPQPVAKDTLKTDPAVQSPPVKPPTPTDTDKKRLETLKGKGVRVLDHGKDVYAVTMSFQNATDENLKAVSGIKPVVFLDVDMGEDVTDNGLKAVEGLDYLKTLRIAGSKKVTDTGIIAILGKCPSVSELAIIDCPITDESLKAVKKLRSLKSLMIPGSKVTDAGMVELVAPGLGALDLSRTSVTDATGTKLARFPDLFQLWLNNTKVTDSTLTAIEGLNQLQAVYVTDTKVTKATVDKFRSTRPGAFVILGP